MKRMIVLLLAMILCISALGITAFAEEGMTMTIESATANRGDEIELAIVVGNNPGIAGLQLTVSYDEAYLEKVSYTGCDMGNGSWAIAKNLIWLAGSASDVSTKNGDIVILKFKVKEDAPIGETTVSLSTCLVSDRAAKPVACTVTAGTVTVACTHNYDEGIVTTQPGCETEGTKIYTCIICGDTYTDSVAATGHSYGEWTVTTAPTCIEAGVETRTCASCGDTETREVAATGHSYGDWTETTAPTCTEAGVETRTCTVCGEAETREVAALGHNCDNWTATKEPTCTEAGLKTGTCSVCGESQATEVIPALGHTVGEWVNDVDNHWHVCSVCEEKVDAAAHTFDWIVDKKATAKEDGLKHEECSVCGYAKEGVKIPATGEELDDVPQTGDLNADPAMFILMMFCAAAAAGVMIFKRKVIK